MGSSRFHIHHLNPKESITPYLVGGIVVLVVIYAMRDYIVIGFVSAGAIYLYKLATDKKGRS